MGVLVTRDVQLVAERDGQAGFVVGVRGRGAVRLTLADAAELVSELAYQGMQAEREFPFELESAIHAGVERRRRENL